MSSRSSFKRKIAYLAAIAILLIPMYWLSHPATTSAKGGQGSPGGKLARLRNEYNLNPAQLGEIDPASVTIKLATLGMRGVAANILWESANNFRMKKDWTNFGATLNQITKVQPNFINVWMNQAWNLSYNISVEFDDYRQRYRWVIKGIDFLKDGMKYNQKEPLLLHEVGRITAQKIGRADEHKQFRKLFKEDDDVHGPRPYALRDNWLVGKEWFERAVEMVDSGIRMMGKTPLFYRADGPMAQMYYSIALENEGTFGEVAKAAWAAAADEWRRYGDLEFVTTYIDEDTLEPIVIRLNDKEAEQETANKLVEELNSIQPGLQEKLIADKRAQLTDAEREALETAPEKRTGKQHQLAAKAEQSLDVTYGELARSISGPRRKEAIQMAKDAEKHKKMAGYIGSYRGNVNFDYWRMRAQAEQTADMLDARQRINQGDAAYGEADLIAARKAYEEGMERWHSVLVAFPTLAHDQIIGEELLEVIRRYRRILAQLDEPFPENFILQDIIDEFDYHSSTPVM